MAEGHYLYLPKSITLMSLLLFVTIKNEEGRKREDPTLNPLFFSSFSAWHGPPSDNLVPIGS